MDLFALTSVFLIGTAVFVPVDYLLSCIFHSILWGTVITLILFSIGAIRFRKKFKRITLDWSSGLLLFFALTFSTWMMFKTFHGGLNGELYVGSNNVFDFGHSLGIVRSFSWGSNLPMMSPFESGLPFFYHFFFYFWVAVLEYVGLPIVWAMNIPSILSFTALLIVIYYLPQKLAKQKPLVGWVAVLLTITNSSLTFWMLLPKLSSLWQLQTYPFAGPFDGSTISIFVTLNNFVNQRHLAFAIAFALFLYMSAFRSKILLGVLTGVLMLWNSVIYVFTVAAFSVRFALKKEWNSLIIYATIALISGGIWLVPIAGFLVKSILFLRSVTSGITDAHVGNIAGYLWQNLGILPLVAGIGFFVVPKKTRDVWIPFIFLFFLACVLASRGGFEQKTYSFFIIGINVLAAIGLAWIWKKVNIVAVLLLFVLTVSGFVDLMPIKNEFAYPLIGNDTVAVISWIKSSTPKNAVFVSYSDMIDPVVLAGRTNYFGFFGNVGWYDRSPVVAKIYSGDMDLAKKSDISYILIPKWNKPDFFYQVDITRLARLNQKVYEDKNYIIFHVSSP